jgi:uncharacterized NAD(P)/FAD-binding protein YdhS
MKSVAIVGGGFCGTVVAAQLLARSEIPIRVCLFDRTGTFGAGIAYSTDEPNHFLNVPAVKMSALEGQPDHFTDWLRANKIDVGDGFVLRRVYRRYLQSLLRQPPLNPESEMSLHSESVVGLEGGFRLRTASGQSYRIDDVVLATGYLTNSRFDALSPFESGRWPTQAQKAIVIGSGLSALDGAASVLGRFPHAEVTLLSRHGQIAEPFVAAAPCTLSTPPPTVREIVRWLRSEIERAGCWVAVFDAMRPRWNDLWLTLPEADRRRFLRHLRPLFDRHRHRVPPGQAAALAPYWNSGQLRLLRGEAVSATPGEVTLRDGRLVKADLVLDASGANFDWAQSDDPLVGQLLASGQVQSGPLNMGILAEASGRIAPRLYTLGPSLRGVQWETTAVPELRRQADQICLAILRSPDV